MNSVLHQEPVIVYQNKSLFIFGHISLFLHLFQFHEDFHQGRASNKSFTG